MGVVSYVHSRGGGKKLPGKSHFYISTLRDVFNDVLFRSDYTAGGG